MWKTLQLALAIALTAAAAPAAQLRPSSDLLLPWFEVDLEPSGMTTLFAVGNASEKPVEVLATLRTNWGIAILEVPFTLQPDEIRTVNLRDWLHAESLAEASGQASPKDKLYYGSEVRPGRAVGSVTLRIQGEARDALWGDWFVVDAAGGVARGENLVDIDRSGAHSALCRRHLLRYLNGGGFAGDTEVIVWRETQGMPSANPGGTPDGTGIRLTAEASVLSEPGRPVESRQIELQALDKITVADLGLEESFGALRIETADDVFIGLRHSAENRYSVALQAYCLASSCEGKKTALGVDILLDGQDAGGPRGPLVDSGSRLDWALVISNRGKLPVTGIEVKGLDASCPAGELAAGESMACTATGTALSSPQTVAVEVIGRSSCAEVSAYGTGYYEGVLVDVFP
jgi:hypothetical protein